MPRTAIMADSNCGIMPAEESNYGIHILPMPIIIDGKTYFEGIDITSEEFYRKQTSVLSLRHPSRLQGMWLTCGLIFSQHMMRLYSSLCPPG